MSERRSVSAEELAEQINVGEIDTVLVVFPDLQGRLIGKRTNARFYLEHVANGEGTENCNYLIATDMENVPVPGYRFASYDLGYGDMVAMPDEGTIRVTPWLPKTALVLADLLDVDTREPIEVSPRQILRRQEEAAEAMGFTAHVASEIEFYLFHDSLEEVWAKGFRDLRPHTPYYEDYHILQTSKDEYVIGDLRRHLEDAGVPVEFSKGEAGRGQHEINLEYTTPVEMADRNLIYKNAAKEIAHLHGRSVTFMAKWNWDDTGSSCHVHSSLCDAKGTSVLADHHAEHGMTDTFRWYLGGLLATAREMSLLFAPTINSYKRFQPGHGHRPGWPGASTTARSASARWATARPAVECRIPGSDANSYLAFAATLAGGLYGIRNKIDPGDPYMGNGYEGDDLPRVPASIVEAIELWRGSEVAREAFGDEVHHHILNMAEQEWLESNRCVTDWELRRYFERI